MGIPDYQPPLTLEVIIPSEREKNYGVHSVTHDGSKRYYTRSNAEDTAMIEKACELLDIKPASFIHSVAVSAAAKLVEHHNAYLKSRGGG